jgi:hypothetical protein
MKIKARGSQEVGRKEGRYLRRNGTGGDRGDLLCTDTLCSRVDSYIVVEEARKGRGGRRRRMEVKEARNERRKEERGMRKSSGEEKEVSDDY